MGGGGGTDLGERGGCFPPVRSISRGVHCTTPPLPLTTNTTSPLPKATNIYFSYCATPSCLFGKCINCRDNTNPGYILQLIYTIPLHLIVDFAFRKSGTHGNRDLASPSHSFCDIITLWHFCFISIFPSIHPPNIPCFKAHTFQLAITQIQSSLNHIYPCHEDSVISLLGDPSDDGI